MNQPQLNVQGIPGRVVAILREGIRRLMELDTIDLQTIIYINGKAAPKDTCKAELVSLVNDLIRERPVPPEAGHQPRQANNRQPRQVNRRPRNIRQQGTWWAWPLISITCVILLCYVAPLFGN